jgi:hypothetical protein
MSTTVPDRLRQKSGSLRHNKAHVIIAIDDKEAGTDIGSRSPTFSRTLPPTNCSSLNGVN